jgi:hypothetical protein
MFRSPWPEVGIKKSEQSMQTNPTKMAAIPDGYADVTNYHVTKRIPLGSWDRWLRSCYATVEGRFKFQCTWPLLVGMNVGMLTTGDERAAIEFRTVSSRQYNRPVEARFKLFMLVLVDALCGTDARVLEQTHRGNLTKSIRRVIPRSILEWPMEDARTQWMLQEIKPLSSAFPIARTVTQIDEDFYVNLLYGYYVTSRDSGALDRLYEYRKRYPRLIFKSLLRTDEHLSRHFEMRDAGA